MFASYAFLVSLDALVGRSMPKTDSVDLRLPLGSGIYLVANGGASETINGHFLTLEPATDRQRAYRGQSYAVDLVKITAMGWRAPSWRPSDPSMYHIFGEPVFSPCTGTVTSAIGEMPDMPVPQSDSTRLEGNHVFLDCDNFGVLLAHFRQGSLAVSVGDQVISGQKVGEVGNSGQTFEPHLHMHAQNIVSKGYFLSGEPLHLTLDGRFPVHNGKIVIKLAQ